MRQLARFYGFFQNMHTRQPPRAHVEDRSCAVDEVIQIYFLLNNIYSAEIFRPTTYVRRLFPGCRLLTKKRRTNLHNVASHWVLSY
jgi:hypothetical protein